MGAAQSSMRPAGMVLPVSYLGELGSEIQYEKSMGSSRFLKPIKARHRSGALVIKVFVKLDSHMDLRPTSKRIAAERAALADCPNVLPYSQALATERAGYLIRQWLASNLYDRISTRPFLTMIEKKWIAFQLLSALKDTHARKVSHGDIKSENVLVTSWNWVYLTDFSSAFKPTYIPEDDPSDFSYFFDTSGRRTCYLAPERFYSQDSDIGRKKATLEVGRSLGKITQSMDVFSLGCVLAELFMEGAPPFTLAQLLQYRNGDYTLDGYLAQIEDEGVRNLVRSMISLDPAARQSCEQYYIDSYDQVFPASFYDYFHDFVASINEISAVNPAHSVLSKSGASVSGTSTPQIGSNTTISASAPETDTQLPLPTNADEIINRIWTEFEQIERRLDPQGMRQSSLEEHPHIVMTSSDSVFPVMLPLPLSSASASLQPVKVPTIDGPAVIILSLVCSNLRNCAYASSILRGFDVLLAISKYLTDETKLDRMLPFVVSLLQNDAASVRAAALRTLTQTLISIETITPSNAAIFPQYILPNIVPFASDPDEPVRCLLAQSLPSLAESGQWYLDMTQAMKAEGTFKLTRAHDFDGAPYEMSYDASLLDLQGQIQELMNTLLVDPSSAVRRALVLNITPLCAFLGRARTADILGLMTTHLNDRDWRLRGEFFASMVGVSTCISVKSVDEYVLPLLAGALADSEEQVTSRELSSLSTLTSLGIHQKRRLWDALFAVIPLLYHPNIWIRSGSASFIAAASKQLSETERWCCLYPGLRKVLSVDIGTIDELDIMSALPPPVSRSVYEAAIAWALRSPGSKMWQGSISVSGMRLAKAIEAAMQAPTLATDDKLEMQKMQTLGMSEADSYKLLALRTYIKQIAVTRKSTSATSSNEPAAETLSFVEETRLADFGVVPQNIIFSTTDNLGARFASRTTSSDGWSRGALAAEPASNAPLEYNARTPIARSVSGSSTADALRRRLAMTNTSSTSLSSMQAGGSPRNYGLVARPALPASSPSVDGERIHTKEDNTDTLSNTATAVSSTNPAAPSPLSKQRSRVNMHGVELSKASPAVGEDTTTAIGHLTSEAGNEGASMSGVSTPIAIANNKTSGGRFHSTYEGDDPAIKQLLDRAYLDSYREPMPEFGPFIPDKVSRRRMLRPGARERVHRCPEGVLIGNLVEHMDAVTSLAVAPDHLFFATGSADGTIKIWDTTRLEKNVTSRSRQTINQGGRVTSVILLENSHCVVSASTNGSVWVSRVDIHQQPGQMPRYGKVATIRQHLVDSSAGDYATCMLHYDTDSASNLVYATMQSKIVILDVRTLRSITTYQQPNHTGPISCMCIDKKHAWLLTGSLSGYLTLWDLRFGLQLRTWKVGSEKTGGVQSCTIHSTKGKGRWVIVTLDNCEGFETWDIGTAQRVERFMLIHDLASKEVLRDIRRQRATSTASTNSRNTGQIARAVDETPAQAIQKLMAHAEEVKARHDTPSEPQSENPAAALHGFQHRPSRPAINTILHGLDYGHASGTSALGSLPPVVEMSSSGGQPTRTRHTDAGWIISAGEDRRLVFWDLSSVEKSSLIVGVEEGEDKASYGRENVEGTDIFTEIRSNGKGTTNSSKRTNLTAGSQQNLLRAHQDAITALALLDLPFRCVVSADRSGNVKVWE